MRKLLIIAAALLLSSCGFHLRGQLAIPKQLHSIQLKSATPFSHVSNMIRNQFPQVGIEVLPETAMVRAPITLQILSEKFTQQSNAINHSTQINQLNLRYTLVFTLKDSQGKSLLAPTHLMAQQHIVTSSNQTLGAEQEISVAKENMAKVLVNKLLYRLSAPETAALLKPSA